MESDEEDSLTPEVSFIVSNYDSYPSSFNCFIQRLITFARTRRKKFSGCTFDIVYHQGKPGSGLSRALKNM